MRKVPIVTGEIYHIFNRGVNKSNIFFLEEDYRRFLQAAIHYKTKTSKFSYEKDLGLNDPVSLSATGEVGVQILAYSLMPNHFHLLVKQLIDGGITSYIRHLANSYSHYVSVRHKRSGPLFEGRFKNVLVESQEQLIHVSRYIHLNPLVANIVSDLENYPWSSYLFYVKRKVDGLCEPAMVIGHFKSGKDYESFVLNQADYGRKLEKIKHLALDPD